MSVVCNYFSLLVAMTMGSRLMLGASERYMQETAPCSPLHTALLQGLHFKAFAEFTFQLRVQLDDTTSALLSSRNMAYLEAMCLHHR